MSTTSTHLQVEHVGAEAAESGHRPVIMDRLAQRWVLDEFKQQTDRLAPPRPTRTDRGTPARTATATATATAATTAGGRCDDER